MKDKNALCAVVEALIFMSDRPLGLKKIHSHIGEEVDFEDLQEAVVCLQKEYRSARHGISLMEVAGGFQFRTKQDYAGYIKKFCKTVSLVLSPTAMEVLAVIAYRGPIAKNDIDKIRGVDSSYIVRSLMEKGLIRISGRSKQLGRSSLYETTKKFLEIFNLSALSDLPLEYELEEMVEMEGGNISDIKTFSHDRESFYSNELEELDRLGEEIKKISADTDFTKDLKKECRSEKEGGSKSAFDILADHIGKKDIVTMNTLAVQSEPISIGKLIDKKTGDKYDEELAQDEPALKKGEDKLEHLTGKMIDGARKLDLNLDFITEEER